MAIPHDLGVEDENNESKGMVDAEDAFAISSEPSAHGNLDDKSREHAVASHFDTEKEEETTNIPKAGAFDSHNRLRVEGDDIKVGVSEHDRNKCGADIDDFGDKGLPMVASSGHGNVLEPSSASEEKEEPARSSSAARGQREEDGEKESCDASLKTVNTARGQAIQRHSGSYDSRKDFDPSPNTLSSSRDGSKVIRGAEQQSLSLGHREDGAFHASRGGGESEFSGSPPQQLDLDRPDGEGSDFDIEADGQSSIRLRFSFNQMDLEFAGETQTADSK
jgi:hypothetical protein